MNIKTYLDAGYPALAVETLEPLRCAAALTADNSHTIYQWDILRGITERDGRIIDDATDPLGALRWLAARSDTVLIAHNLGHFIRSVEVVQGLQNYMPIYKGSGCCLVILGAAVDLPAEISPFFTVLRFGLPDLAHLGRIMADMGDELGIPIDPASIEAARGLTEFEAETAFAHSLVLCKRFDAEIVTERKKDMIRRSGFMEFWPSSEVSELGGLDLLKMFVRNRKRAFSPDNVSLPRPKGLLLVGIPGTGKSLACKVAASILELPLIRLDVSALKGSLVGETERNTRRALTTVDAFGSCVLWLDEVEKAFAGVHSSGRTDSGTTSGMFGTFLTWMQESRSGALVMATANNVNELPPEFLRAGRFDAVFFVDLPSAGERAEIADIMNRRYQADIPDAIVAELAGWTGAEIEQLAKDSLFDGVESAARNIVPLSKTMREQVAELQEWAKARARRANVPDEAETSKIRRVSI